MRPEVGHLEAARRGAPDPMETAEEEDDRREGARDDGPFGWIQSTARIGE